MARSADTVLYLTFDGVLQPLGHSQVFRVISGLADHGYRYELFSLERERDLMDGPRVARIERALRERGVRWRRLPYETGRGAYGVGTNLRRTMAALTTRIIRGGVRLVHARGYHAGLVALAVARTMGVPYVFDARGYWIDEQLDAGRWFTNPRTLSVARALEHRLYSNATAVVTLTELHARDVRERFCVRQVRQQSVVTIPTCADYNEFRVAAKPENDELVLGLIGSVNRSYRTLEASMLCSAVLELNRNARLLVLTHQPEEMERVLRRCHPAFDRVKLESVPQEAMPSRLNEIDWGVMLLSESPAKRASMPTKLAEFFASGVRPLHYGCNSEVTDWIRRAGSGFTLPSLSRQELMGAAHAVASSGRASPSLLERAREITAPHFSLSAGIARYHDLLCGLGVPRP